MSLNVLRIKEATLIHCDNLLSNMHAVERMLILTFTLWTSPQRLVVCLTENLGLLHIARFFGHDNVPHYHPH
jgi:hypothetical protein